MKAVKYTFDTHFDTGATRASAQKAEPKFDAKAVEKISEEAFAMGMASGKDQAAAETAHKISECLNQISSQLHMLEGQETARRQAAKRDIARLAHIIGAKLAATLVAQKPAAEIEALVADCLETCRQEPKLVIRLNEALVEPMRQKIDQMKQERHFEGQIVLLGDPAIPLGDGRIEWNDGGAERSGAALNLVIEDIVERYVRSLDASAPEMATEELLSA